MDKERHRIASSVFLQVLGMMIACVVGGFVVAVVFNLIAYLFGTWAVIILLVIFFTSLTYWLAYSISPKSSEQLDNDLKS